MSASEIEIHGGLRVLLAEDNSVNQRVALQMLRRLGYTAVDVANNGVEALEALHKQHYDLVLMDVQMPLMDGLEATRQIHKQWPPEDRPYIAGLSANAMREDIEAAQQAGMDVYLSKPFKVDDLRSLLDDLAKKVAARHGPAGRSDVEPT